MREFKGVISIQVVPSIFQEASGVSPAVIRMAEHLALQGSLCEVHALDPLPENLPSVTGISFHGYPTSFLRKSLRVSPPLFTALKKQCRKADILHNHSLWLWPNIIPVFCRKNTKARLVVSPHGTLRPWALNLSRVKKKIIWRLGQEKNLKEAHCIHVTSESEYKDMRKLKLKTPIAIIPFGIDMPSTHRKITGEDNKKILLFLSRIHPTKGIDLLLHAWRRLQHLYPEWRLMIVGPDPVGHATCMQNLSIELMLERVEFAGPVYGKEKKKVYRSADLYVLPSHTENFGFTIAEALSYGLPVVVSQGTPWQEVEVRKCGQWVALNVDSLAEGLSRMMKMSTEERTAAGRRGRDWMKEEFSWTVAGQKMLTTYDWLTGKQPRPEWVHL